ncbi:HAMP domain-containing sensor histidine kinase [Rhizobium leguminosarum]|uniref:HAMP domain-containing sensor histidine kinase n=1 Tax=Rhizobium leguminosarum TaxID=384 RepID=UPI001AE3D766|nr:HAMP domain-containing sensor histidine kinase [Rhizobium leguminosarum]MBP2449464.1 two-component system sensor histidine kinase AdeS [Rhizobium leguminosarum]
MTKARTRNLQSMIFRAIRQILLCICAYCVGVSIVFIILETVETLGGFPENERWADAVRLSLMVAIGLVATAIAARHLGKNTATPMTKARTRNLQSMIFRAMSAQTLLCICAYYVGASIVFIILEKVETLGGFPENGIWEDAVLLCLVVTIGLIAAAIVAPHLGKNIASALPPIAAAAHSIAAGDYTVRVPLPPNSFEEIDALIVALNAMAERLEHLDADLRYRNSTIAHEFRTSSTALSLNLGALSDGVIQPSQDFCSRLLVHVRALYSMAGDLEDLSLSRADKLDLKIEEIDLSVEAETVTSSMEYGLVLARITLEKKFDRAVCLAEPVRMQQVLRELLNNCRRYARASTVTIHTWEDEDWAMISCYDTGPGLPAEVQHRAFDRNWRGSDSSARVPEGRGLGLAWVKTIVDAHHGKISTCRIQGGFNVTIKLPKRAFSDEQVRP